MEQILGVECDVFETKDELTALKNGVVISDQVKDKALKGTKSWSTNLLIRVHFILKQSQSDKAAKSPKELADKLRPAIESETIRVEPSGFVTIIDTQKAEKPQT